MPWPEQQFIISHDIIANMDDEDMESTIRILKDLDLYQPPYADFAILIDGAVYAYENNDGTLTLFSHLDEDKMKLKEYKAADKWRIHYHNGIPTAFYAKDQNGWRSIGVNQLALEGQPSYEIAMYDLLLTTLSIRNVEKVVKEDKLAKLKIGKNKRIRYTTTIKLGTIYRSDGVTPIATGEKRRPHLRRGHIRNQPFGPGLLQTKKIFIQPMFINATDEIQQLVRDNYKLVPET